MLIMARHFGQRIEVTHRSGDALRILLMPPRPGERADVRLAIGDDGGRFAVAWPGRAGWSPPSADDLATAFGWWVGVMHRSGDVLRIRVMGPYLREPADVRLVFADAARHYEIARLERSRSGPALDATPAAP